MATDADVIHLRGTLLKLRTGAGLTARRLRNTEIDLRALTELPAVRDAAQAGVPPATAIVDTVTAAATELDPTTRLIADVALALGLLTDQPDLTHQLYRADLGVRRVALVEGWQYLHELMGVSDAPPTATVRALRGSLEEQALGVLAQRCLFPEPRVGRGSVVVVVGGVALDHVSVVEALPVAGTSVQSTAFHMNPGGRGLHLASAVARLGFDVRFVAAIGDDEAATSILDHLRHEGVATDLLVARPGEATPVAQVIVLPNGNAATIGWRNELRVALSTRDMCSPVTKEALAAADAVLVSLETPVDVVRWTLATARTLPRRPLVVLQATPPLERPQQIYDQLAGVDHLVGSEWALRQLLPGSDGDDFEEVLRRLLTMGVTTVCVMGNFRCRLRSHELDATIESTPAPIIDPPAAREAFSVAVVCQLLRLGRGGLTHEALARVAATLSAKVHV